MANYDYARGFWPANNNIRKIKRLCKTGETVAIGDAMIPDGSGGGMTIALANSGSLYGGGVVCPQENEAGTMVSAQRANLFTTSTAGVYVWLWPFFDPDTNAPNLFIGQCSGTPASGMEGELKDIEGATGVMEVNENATTEQVIEIVDLLDGELVNIDSSGRVVPNEVGANGLVKFRAVAMRAL